LARPFRYSFIVALVALGAVLAAAGGWRYARASSPVTGPIILLSIDALRADHLPAYGYRGTKTPAIDTLAADGVVFEHAYSHAPATLPSHASMLSGRLPLDTGVRDDAGFTVKESERLLAEILRDRGYSTGGVVSTFALRRESGIAQGFGFFDDRMMPAAPDATVGDVARNGAESERVAEQWLDSAGTSRSFLFLQLGDLHLPYAPPGRYAHGLPYDGEVAYADEIVGRLLHYLKAHQLYDRSTIVLSAAQGEGLGDHGEAEHGLFVYEEVLRVPLIIKQAAGEGAGRRVTDLVEHVDLMPTILDLAKAPDPGNLRGRSLKPLLNGTGGTGGASRIPARTAYAESFFGRYHFGWHELTTVSDGRYRYIAAPRDELYDLQSDPGETTNLAADPAHAAIAAALRASLAQLAAGSPPKPADIAAPDRERFQVLGDVGGSVPQEPGTDPADPKDTYAILEAYREATDLATSRQWVKAIDRLQPLVRANPSFADVWRQIATFAFDADQPEQAADAYKRVILLQPEDVNAQLGATATLVRLRHFDEARQHAELAVNLAPDRDVATRSAAHEWLARIALVRHDADTAREEADLTQQADPALPMPLFVKGRLLYEQARYAEALTVFEQAVADLTASHGRPMTDLHFYLADTLDRQQRGADAEGELLAELKAFPRNTRARAALATLHHAAGRAEEVEDVMDDLVRIAPTPDTYNLAARLWTSFGNRSQAASARAEALRLSARAATVAHQ
jgi:choline-sulfatase